MKARIIQQGNFFVGQLYGDFEQLVLGIPIRSFKGWGTVTGKCCTRLGARIELASYKRKHHID